MSAGTHEKEIEAIAQIKSSSSIKASLIDLTEASELLKPSLEKVPKIKKKRKKVKKMIRSMKGVESVAITEEQSEQETTHY